MIGYWLVLDDGLLNFGVLNIFNFTMITFWNKGMTTNFCMPGGSLWSAAYAKQSDLYCCFNNDAEILISGCVFCNETETSWSQLCWAQFFYLGSDTHPKSFFYYFINR